MSIRLPVSEAFTIPPADVCAEIAEIMTSAAQTLQTSLNAHLPHVPAIRKAQDDVTYNLIAERNITAHLGAAALNRKFHLYAEIPINGRQKIDLMVVKGTLYRLLIEAKRIYPDRNSAKSMLNDFKRMSQFDELRKKYFAGFGETLTDSLANGQASHYGAIFAYTTDDSVSEDWREGKSARTKGDWPELLKVIGKGYRHSVQITTPAMRIERHYLLGAWWRFNNSGGIPPL